MSFKPGIDNKRRSCYFQVSRYDWSSSDDAFREIVGINDAKEWVKKCNQILHHIRDETEDDSNESEEQTPAVSNEPAQLETNCGHGSTEDGNNEDVRRKASSTSFGEDTSNPRQKRCKPNKANLPDGEAEFQNRASECEIGEYILNYISATIYIRCSIKFV